MFDVNGIEDFYDKNAMITYEINGHEIPVHMHPKLTPQSKSLFPEYMKDSPASMGLVRGSTSNFKPGTTDSRKNTGTKLVSTFTGMGINDMPEYKTSVGSRLANLDSGRQKLTKAMQFYVNKQQQDKTGDSVPESTARVFKSTGVNDNTNSKVSPERYAHISNKDLKYFQDKIAQDNIHHQPTDQDNRISLNARNEHSGFVDQRSQATLVQNQPQFEDNSKESDNTGLKYSVPDRQSQDVEKTNDFSEHENPEKKDTEDVLFEKLESLHRNLEKDKLENEAAIKSVSEDSDEPKKNKAKARILNLLGALTDKLKGMESIVSGNRDKKVEKFISDKNEALVSHMTGVNEAPANRDTSDSMGQEELKNQAEIQKQQDRYSSHETALEPSIKESASFVQDNRENREQNRLDDTAEVRHQTQYEDDEKYSVPVEQSASERDSQDGGRAMLMKTFRRIGGSLSNSPSSHHNKFEETKHENEIIEQFQDHNKPFIMNTKAIDFKPSLQSDTGDDYPEIAKVNADGEEEVMMPVSRFHGKNSHNIRHFHDNDDTVDDYGDDGNDIPQHHAMLTSSKKRKYMLDDEDAKSRQTLLHFRKHGHNVDDEENQKIKSDDENDDYDDEESDHDKNSNEKIKHHRKHRHHHSYHDEDDDEQISTTEKHHHRHYPTVESDDSVDEEDSKNESVDQKPSKTLTKKPKQHSTEPSSDASDFDGEENAKMYAVEEDLAAADEKRGRSIRPTASGIIFLIALKLLP